MKLYRWLSLVFIICFQLKQIAGKNFDVSANIRAKVFAKTLKTVLRNSIEEIVFIVSNSTDNILTDLVDDFLPDIEIKRVLIDESLICELSLINTCTSIIIAQFEATETFANYFKCVKDTKHLLLVEEHIFSSDSIGIFLKSLWKNGILDITFVVILNEYVQFYTWFPMDFNNNCGRFTNIKLISSSNNTNLFRKKVIKHLTNCRIKCAWIEEKPFSDLYTKVFDLISIKSLSELIMDNKYKEFGIRFYWEDSMLKMFTKQNVDVIFANTFINTSEFSYGPMFYTDESYIAVRKPTRRTSYKPLLKVFSYYLWFVIIAIYILVCFIIILYKSRINIDNIKIFLTLFMVCVGSSLPYKRYIENITRRLFIFYIYYSFILNAMYLSKLSSLLTKPAYEEQVANREDLYLNRLKIHYNAYIEKIYCIVFTASENVDARNLLKEIDYNMYDSVDKLVYDQNYTVVTLKSLLDTYPHLTKQIGYFESFFDVATLFHSYVLKKDNPINIAINYWATELIEKGFVSKLLNDMKRMSTLESYKYLRNNTISHSFAVLTLTHLSEIFVIIMYGYIFSITVFLFEFFTYLLMKKINLMRDTSAL